MDLNGWDEDEVADIDVKRVDRTIAGKLARISPSVCYVRVRRTCFKIWRAPFRLEELEDREIEDIELFTGPHTVTQEY